MVGGSQPRSHPRGYASVIPDEESAGETVTSYTLTIFPAWLDRLSDLACHWVFAHELGHIALGLRFGSIVIKGKPYTRHGDFYEEAPPQNIHEDAADRIALEWGFDSALQAFLEEDSRK